jgi:hypothetical protein
MQAMNYEEAIQQAVADGAIRAFRLSDNLAFVYRLRGDSYEARGLYGQEGDWRLGERLVSQSDIGTPERGLKAGWHAVPRLPSQAKPIETDAARQNPGYARPVLRQCYTCKQTKPEAEFARSAGNGGSARSWECNACYGQRMQELARFELRGDQRKGDALDKDTIASQPPPEGRI